MRNEGRMIYPDLLRILAAFLVVLIHVTSVVINEGHSASIAWMVCMALNSMSHWAVPVFFMISGMLFLDPKREVTMEKLFRKHITRIVLCIVIWGFFYSLLDQYLYGGLSLRSPFLAIYGILTGATGYHLWFLYALMALYLATPTLRIFTAHASRRQVEYALVVWFLCCICVGEINRLAAELLDITQFLPVESVVIVDNAGFYLLGYYLHRYSFSDKWANRLYILAVVCLLSMPILNLFFVGAAFSFSDQMGLGNCIVASGAFLFASRLRTELFPKRFCRVVHLLSEQTFGVYLIHVFFVALFFQILKLDPFTPIPILGVPFSTVVIFLLSALTAKLLSRLSMTKKLV